MRDSGACAVLARPLRDHVTTWASGPPEVLPATVPRGAIAAASTPPEPDSIQRAPQSPPTNGRDAPSAAAALPATRPESSMPTAVDAVLLEPSGRRCGATRLQS